MKKLLNWKRWLVLLVLAAVLYLIIGMMAPFWHMKDVSEEYKKSFDVSQFYGEQESVDRAAVVESSMDALDERIRLINRASERIIMSTFDMRPGESTRDVLCMLQEAADRGVRVQILVDGISGLIRMEGNELFYAVSAHPNIEIKIYNKPDFLRPWTIHGRMHDKYLIIDDKYFLLGGRNTFDYFLGDYIEDDKSLDREVLIYNTAGGTERSHESSLFQVEDYFNEIWNMDVCRDFHNDTSLLEKKGVQDEVDSLKARYAMIRSEKAGLFEDDSHYDEITVPVNKVTLVSNPKGIYGKEPVVWYELEQLMKNADEKVVIHTPYAVMSDDMYEGLEEISGKEIECTMMINSVENGDNFVASSDYLLHKDRIIDTDVQLYEYDGGDSYHGKSILIDDNISVIGSYNLDLRSTYVDTELMLVVDSKELNADLAAKMDGLQQKSRKVLDEKNYEVPEGLVVADVPFWKRIAWAVTGVVLQPFRVLV